MLSFKPKIMFSPKIIQFVRVCCYITQMMHLIRRLCRRFECLWIDWIDSQKWVVLLFSVVVFACLTSKTDSKSIYCCFLDRLEKTKIWFTDYKKANVLLGSELFNLNIIFVTPIGNQFLFHYKDRVDLVSVLHLQHLEHLHQDISVGFEDYSTA